MRTNKIAIKWSFVICVLSIGISLAFEYKKMTYFSNIFVGIFSSGTLTFMISTITYLNDRRKTLETFYVEMYKAMKIYNLFENNHDHQRCMDIVLQMDQFDYTNLDNTFGDMCFFWNNKKTRKYIYENLYVNTIKMRQLISDTSFHFKKYKKAENGNLEAMIYFLTELDNVIMERTPYEYENDGITCKGTTIKNGLVTKLQTELGGKYYKIMYLTKKT